MDNYVKVEKLLSDYKMLKVSIKNMEKEIVDIGREDGLKGIDYEGIPTSPTNKTSDVVADTVLSKMEKIHFLEHQIRRSKRKIESIDRAMEELEERERIIVTEKYINAKQWWQVASIVKYSESWCKQIRREAVNRLVTGIYGPQ